MLENGIKVARKPERLFMVKLVLLSLSVSIAITLYLLSEISFLGLAIIVLGGIWNFFVRIDNFISFVLCALVSLIALVLCFEIGLYAQAMLYGIFYIALQFVALLAKLRGNTIYVRYDRMGAREAYFVSLGFITFSVVSLAVSILSENGTLPVFDALASALLALSAYLHARNFKEYYYIRPIALLAAIAMLSCLVAENSAGASVVALLLLYIMYFALDCAERAFLIESDLFKRRSLRNINVSSSEKIFKQEENLERDRGDNGGINA